MALDDDDGRYGRDWGYRVFSAPWTCPDDWNVGHRYLTVHRVDYVHGRGVQMQGTHDHPLPGDFFYIEAEPASPSGIGMEEYLLDLERIMQASDKPTLIKAEFQRYFDHSEKTNREHDRQAGAYNAAKAKAKDD